MVILDFWDLKTETILPNIAQYKYYNMEENIRNFKFPTFTEEELREAHESHMKYLRENPNNFSFWFPKLSVVKRYGLMVPKSHVVDVPENIYKTFFQEGKNDMRIIRQWAHKAILSVIQQHFQGKEVFLKNGCYSGKFSFNKCCHLKANATLKEIVAHLCNIQYDSLMKETDGNLEVVLREWIQPEDGTNTIYGGMPLRPEMRLFYDFTSHKPLYWVNYWDWNDCHDPICFHWNGERTEDADVYEETYPSIDERVKKYREKYWQTIIDALQQVNLMKGIWSVDFLFDKSGVWLIDAAIGSRSHYWDVEKVKAALNQ